MKKIICSLVILASFAAIFMSCEEETDFTNNPPQIDLITETLAGSRGETVTIKANLTDDYVLKYAKVTSVPLSINTTIYISKRYNSIKVTSDVIKSSENFSYDFIIPNNINPGNYEIKLEVKNATGQISNAIVTLTVN